VTVAQDSFGVDITSYTRERVSVSELISGFGRFDWQIADGHAVSVRGNFATLEAGGDVDRDPDLGRERLVSLGSVVDGWDLSTAGIFTSRFGSVVSQELRAGVDRSERQYKSTPLLGTRVVDGGLGFGTDPALPAEFRRLTVRGSETLHFNFKRHQLKLGLSGTFESFEQRYSHARGGEFGFAGTDEFAGLAGTFEKATGSAPFAEFQSWALGAYLQDVWSAARGLAVQLGFRYDYEALDQDAVRLNTAWLEKTGLDNTVFDDHIHKVSGRLGFLWNLSERSEWLVSGAAGIYHDRVSPALFGEFVTHDGPMQYRRGVEDFSEWPEPPSLTDVSPLGPRLTLLGPDFRPPRTGRVSVGLSRLFGDHTAVHLSGTHRYTDHLPRRSDLNRPLAPTARDQYGRPIFGTLEQDGSQLAVEPGSNRRFEEFDLVSGLNADGRSSYWGATVAVERHTGEVLDLLASYTLSWTKDDWLLGTGGGPDAQLTPFPDGLAGRDWADARSDYDVPHRLTIGAQVRIPTGLEGVRVAAFYRIESGRPFTPGFRDGVDANGDGSSRNDPAFVDQSIAGMEELLAEWDCLADQVGQFAERNSCRGSEVHRLDARLAVGLYVFRGHTIEIVADALNILDANASVRDRALYSVDRDGTLVTNPDGTVAVPLVVNPHFGQALARYNTGLALRFGVRMGL
jgi:hypothetical protein